MGEGSLTRENIVYYVLTSSEADVYLEYIHNKHQ